MAVPAGCDPLSTAASRCGAGLLWAVSSAWGAVSAALCFLWQRDAAAEPAVCFSPSPCSDLLPWSVPRYESRAITFLIVFVLAPCAHRAALLWEAARL